MGQFTGPKTASKKELFKVELDEVGQLAVELISLKGQQVDLKARIAFAEHNLIEAMQKTGRKILKLDTCAIVVKSTPAKATVSITRLKKSERR